MRDPLPPAGPPAGLSGPIRVRVVGCGNPSAGDDAVGLIAVREVRSELETLPGVEVVEAGPALNVVHLLEGVDAAVVVDAVRSPQGRRSAGEIGRAEPGPDGLPADVATSLSSHGFGLAEAVALAGALGHVPRIVFLGVEVSDVAVGRPLSAAVAGALPRLVELIRAETRAFVRTLGS